MNREQFLAKQKSYSDFVVSQPGYRGESVRKVVLISALEPRQQSVVLPMPRNDIKVRLVA